MRPVNLIPPDERRGDNAPLRMGNLIYVLVGGLAVLLLGIAVVTLTGKQIKDREAEKASLQQELQQATAQAQNVQAFTDFRTVQENRAASVSSLAQSRFDWSRVLHELALVLPSDVALSSLTGTVSPDVQVSASGASSASGGSDLSGSIKGPSLSISGCAPSQDAVAGFVAALEDIDGVTRVGLGSSKLPDQSSAAPTGEPGNAAASASGSGDCQSGPNVAKFDVVVAFDAVPAPGTASSSPSVPPSTSPPTSSNQVSDGQTQENVARASVREQTSKADAKAHAVLKAGG
jgi:Tfp pilus assembly protein PilN